MGFEIKEVYPLFHFTQKDVDEILRKYNRDMNSAYEDVETIKKWLITQKHLPLHPSDREIFAILIYSKFSIERVKQKIDMKYTIRSLIPEFFEGFLPSSKAMQISRRAIYFVPLPNLNQGNRVLVYKIKSPDEPLLTSHTASIIATFYFEMKTLYDISESEEIILDLENLNVGMMSRTNLMDIKKAMNFFEKSFSNRIAALHLVNMTSLANTVVKLIIESMTEKIRKRVHFHKKSESLLENFPKYLLPKEFGGNEKSLKELNEMFIKIVDENELHFKIISEAKVDESLRGEKLSNDEILGFHGNFKKLNVD